jgi:hypothetical protein
LLGRLQNIDMDTAIELARVPEQIRSFGHVKQASVDAPRVSHEG